MDGKSGCQPPIGTEIPSLFTGFVMGSNGSLSLPLLKLGMSALQAPIGAYGGGGGANNVASLRRLEDCFIGSSQPADRTCEGSVPIFVCAFEPDGASSAQLDFSDPIERIDFDSACSVIDSDPAARLVLITPSPRDLLAVRLRSSSDALKSLRQTSEDIATVLKTYRRARRRILMLDLKVSQRRPDLLASAVQSWRSHRAPEPRPARSAQAPADAPASIIAAALVKGEREALRLAEEFEASLTSLEVEPEDALDLALHAAKQWRTAASAPVSAPPSAGDTLALGDLEAQRAVIARLQSALDECHGELAHIYADSPKAGGPVPADMLRRLDEAELARDAMRADLAALDVEAGHLRRDNRQLRETLDAIRSSNSWKITAPLRNIRGASKGAEDESVE